VNFFTLFKKSGGNLFTAGFFAQVSGE